MLPHACPHAMAKSTDNILTGIANIVTALQLPMANAPFAPPSNSHSHALHQLMDTSMPFSPLAPQF